MVVKHYRFISPTLQHFRMGETVHRFTVNCTENVSLKPKKLAMVFTPGVLKGVGPVNYMTYVHKLHII